MDTSEGQEDFSQLPLSEKLQHKIWKARVSGYNDLTSLFRKTDNDSDFYTYESQLKKIATDANVIAQEAGLDAIYEYVNNAPNPISSRDVVIPSLVEKCLGAAKAGTKKKATDIILLYAEVDTNADPVVDLVIPGLSAKQPKLVAQSTNVLKELVRLFGTKYVSPKPIVKKLPTLFGHSDKNVRSEASALTVELYRWIGAALSPQLSELKPVQIKELEEQFSKLPDTKPTPERVPRSAVVEETPDVVETVQEETVDAYDLADAVDITAKLPADFYTLLESKKWQERRGALDALIEATKVPKIMDKDLTQLAEALAKRINDANILLVGTAAQCIEALASGLRQDFAKYKGTVAPPMLEKLKERKPQILEQLSNGLHAVFSSVPIGDIVENITTGVNHKNPQVRAETVKLLSRCLKHIREAPGKSETKAFGGLMLKTLDDADGNAREASAEGLGTLMKIVGEKAMMPFTDGLDDLKMGKIKEAFEKAEVKAKAPVARRPAPAPAAAPSKAAKPASKPAPVRTSAPAKQGMSMDVDKEVASPKRKSPVRAPGGHIKKPALSTSKTRPTATSAAAPPAATGTKKAAKLPPSSEPQEIKYKFNVEVAESRVSEYIPDQIWEDLSQSQWKTRLVAMESLYTHFEEQDGSDVEAEIVFWCLAKRPGWKEMNFQVMGKLFAIMQLLATKANFSRSCAAIGTPVLVEKLGDIKLKKAAGDCLISFAEKTSLQTVLSLAYPILKKAKSPKVLADSLTWLHSAVMEFGIAGLQVRDMIDVIKFALGNTNASVRTNAITLLGALRLYIGPEVKTFVQDVSPALMTAIETEFNKVAEMEPPQPAKTSAEAAPSTGGGGSDALDSLFPRVDISGQLNKVCAECNDSNWKVRKAALDKVNEIIDGANKRIKPSLGDFPNAVKLRLNDSNKNLEIQALEIVGSLATAMGKPFERYLKLLSSPVTAVLTDNKANVRAAGVATLDHFRQVCGISCLVSTFATSLAQDSPTLRKDLLGWLSNHLNDAVDADMTLMIAPIFSCLQDRNAEVRKYAQACLPAVVTHAGYDAVMRRTLDLKSAQKQTLLPMIEALRGSVERPPSRTTAATADMAQDKTAALATRLKSVGLKKAPLAARPVESRVKASLASAQIDDDDQDNEMDVDDLPTVSQLPRIPRTTRPPPSRIAGGPRVAEDDPPRSRLQEPSRRTGSGTVRPRATPAAVPSAPPDDHIVDYLIAQITSGEPQQSIDALKQLDRLLSTRPGLVLPELEPLANAITLQVRLAFTTVDPQVPTTTRLCKHLVNALVLLFSNAELATSVSQDALHCLLQELAYRLLDQKMLAMESGPQLSKALNVAMVKVLENSQRNVTFCALLSILGTCSASLRPGDLDASKEKYTELVMKCLWKLAKTIQDNLRTGTLRADQLLFEINKFFLATPPAEWKRRAADNVPLGEMPLRTVKTLLLELVNGLGDSIFQHLSLIEDAQRSSVYPYLHHMLEACRKKERMHQDPKTEVASLQLGEDRYAHESMINASRPSSLASLRSSDNRSSLQSASLASYADDHGNETSSVTSATTASAAAAATIVPQLTQPSREEIQPMQVDQADKPLSEYEMNNMLTQIFVKIGTRDQTKQGIIELYEFHKKYPYTEAKVNAYLSQTGTYFQSYIRRGLSNLAAEDKDLRTQQHDTSGSHTSSPSGRSSPSHAMSESKRHSVDGFGSVTDRPSSFHPGNEEANDIKQRLLRLQQKFGYKTESAEPARTSDHYDSGSSVAFPSMRYSSSPGPQSAYAYPTDDDDRAQSVSALKERLAKIHK